MRAHPIETMKMKTILLVAMIAAAAVFAVGVPAQATALSTPVATGAPPGHRMNGPHHMDRKCTVKTVRRHRNGQIVMQKVQSCH
jgi:hypothetical protein